MLEALCEPAVSLWASDFYSDNSGDDAYFCPYWEMLQVLKSGMVLSCGASGEARTPGGPGRPPSQPLHSGRPQSLIHEPAREPVPKPVLSLSPQLSQESCDPRTVAGGVGTQE